MHPEMKSQRKKKNCYSLTIKLPFFLRNAGPFCVEICQHVISRAAKNAPEIMCVLQQKKHHQQQQQHKQILLKGNPNELDHAGTRTTGSVSTQRILLACQGTFFCCFLFSFFVVFFCHTILIFRVLRSLHISRYRRSNN